MADGLHCEDLFVTGGGAGQEPNATLCHLKVKSLETKWQSQAEHMEDKNKKKSSDCF